MDFADLGPQSRLLNCEFHPIGQMDSLDERKIRCCDAVAQQQRKEGPEQQDDGADHAGASDHFHGPPRHPEQNESESSQGKKPCIDPIRISGASAHIHCPLVSAPVSRARQWPYLATGSLAGSASTYHGHTSSTSSPPGTRT